MSPSRNYQEIRKKLAILKSLLKIQNCFVLKRYCRKKVSTFLTDIIQINKINDEDKKKKKFLKTYHQQINLRKKEKYILKRFSYLYILKNETKF